MKLPDIVSVTVTSEQERQLFLDVIEGLGYGGTAMIRAEERWKSLVLYTDSKRYSANEQYHSIYGPEASVSEFLVALHTGRLEKARPKITAGDYTVEFVEGGIQVGCTFVPTATVDQIHAELHKS